MGENSPYPAGEPPVDVPHGMLGWNELLRMGDGVAIEHLRGREASLDFDDAINIQYTSGTTGLPRGSTLSHHNIVNNGMLVANAMRLTHRDRLCIPVPFYHCFGMVLANLVCVATGATMVIPAPYFDAEATLRAVAEERCTALHGVPTMFIAELEHPKFAEFDFSSLRTGIMAGSPCPIEIMKRVVQQMHCSEMTIAYGLTEASPVITQTTTDDPIELRVTTVGKVLPHTEVKIVNPMDGKTVAVGEHGELCTRGYHVMKGYYNNVSATRSVIDGDGWLHTGDLAVMDENGYFKITGRAKDVIIRGGENISPREIEEFLYTCPGISAVQVIGVPDRKYGEQVAAWIRLERGSALTEDDIRTFCEGKIAHASRFRATSSSSRSFRSPSPARCRSSRCARSPSRSWVWRTRRRSRRRKEVANQRSASHRDCLATDYRLLSVLATCADRSRAAHLANDNLLEVGMRGIDQAVVFARSENGGHQQQTMLSSLHEIIAYTGQSSGRRCGVAPVSRQIAGVNRFLAADRREFPQQLKRDHPGDHPDRDAQNTPTSRGIDVPMHNLGGFLGSTSVHRNGMLLRRRTEREHRLCAALGKFGSTNSAVGDAAQDVLHLTRSQFGVNCCHGGKATQGAVGALEPAHGTLMIAKVLISDSHDTGQSVKPVGFVTGQPSTATAALQASRREIKCAGEFSESQPRGSHQLPDDRRREAFADCLAHITIAGRGAAKNPFAP